MLKLQSGMSGIETIRPTTCVRGSHGNAGTGRTMVRSLFKEIANNPLGVKLDGLQIINDGRGHASHAFFQFEQPCTLLKEKNAENFQEFYYLFFR
jgi:hypothetical protein